MPLTPTRASLFIGPSRIVRANAAATSCSLFTKDDVALNIVESHAVKSSSFHGEFDKVFLGAHVEASFVPAGPLGSGVVDLLWNDYSNMAMGQDLCTSADVPLAFHDSSGNGGGTIIASCIGQIPDIVLGPSESFIGSVQWLGCVGTGMALSAASSLYTIGGNTTMVDTAVTSANFRQQCYTAAWGAVTGFTSFEAEDTWKIRFNLKVHMHVVAGVVRKITYQGVEVLASCVPVGPTPANIIAALGFASGGTAATVPGRSQQTVASALTITGTDTTTTVTIPSASVVSGGFRFGSTVLRQGELGWYASRVFTSGAQTALYTIAAG